MTTHQNDLTIDDVMGDPMIRKVMRADRVEPLHLETMLRRLASSRREQGLSSVPRFQAPLRAAPSAACGSFCSL